MKAIIGFVGEKGSGKEACVHTIMGFIGGDRVLHVRFSDILKETLDAWHIPATRANLQKIAIVMQEGFGEGTLAHAIAERIQKSDKELVLLEGLRWDADVTLLQTFPEHRLVYITAKPEVRHQRTQLRAQKVGEQDASFEQFMQEEQAPTEMRIDEIGSKADAILENSGTLEEFQVKVRVLCETMVVPLIGRA